MKVSYFYFISALTGSIFATTGFAGGHNGGGEPARAEGSPQVEESLQNADNADGRQESFRLDKDGKLVHSWQEFPDKNIFRNGRPQWPRNKQNAELGTQVKKFQVMANEDGRLEVFAIGFDGKLWHIWQNDGGWSNWEVLSNSPPMKDMSVVRNGDGRLEVFGIQPGGQSVHVWQVKANKGWSDWQEFGGGGLAHFSGAAFWGKPERLRVFARTAGGDMKAIERNPENGWTDWNDSPSEEVWRKTTLKDYKNSGAPVSVSNTFTFAENTVSYPFRLYLYRGGPFGGMGAGTNKTDFHYYEYNK
jgi:hypothetical protein